MTNLKTR